MKAKHFLYRFFPELCLISILIVVCGGMLSAYHHYQIASKQLEEILLNLRNLRHATVSPSFLLSLTAIHQEYVEKAVQLTHRIPRLPSLSVTPQFFQDKLRVRVSEIIKKANDAHVSLPSDFYLGFSPYRSTLPPRELASELYQELEVIFNLANQLIDLRIPEILAIHRFSSTKEDASFSVSSKPAKQWERKTLDLCFVSDETVFRNAWNSFLKTTPFLTVEALQVVNMQPQPPRKRAETIAKSSEEVESLSNDMGDTSPVEPEIKPIFEREKLKITFRIAMWTDIPIGPFSALHEERMALMK